MAKDPTQGPITRYDETGNPKIMIEPVAEDAQSEERAMEEGLTRSEIINAFGEDLGGKLLDGGYSSLSGMMGATDEDFLAIKGIGPASLAEIRKVVSLEDVKDDADFHPHESPIPLTFAETQQKLEDLTYSELKDLCEADGLSPARSKAHTISVLLEYWFAPVEPVIPEDLAGEYSVRIKRIKGLL